MPKLILPIAEEALYTIAAGSLAKEEAKECARYVVKAIIPAMREEFFNDLIANADESLEFETVERWLIHRLKANQ